MTAVALLLGSATLLAGPDAAVAPSAVPAGTVTISAPARPEGARHPRGTRPEDR